VGEAGPTRALGSVREVHPLRPFGAV